MPEPKNGFTRKKEELYAKLNLSLRTVDIIIVVSVLAIIVALVLGILDARA